MPDLDLGHISDRVEGARLAVEGNAEIASAGRITVSRARDVTGWSRKYSLPFLGYLDEIGVTRRVGDDRVLIVTAEQARAKLPGAGRS